MKLRIETEYGEKVTVEHDDVLTASEVVEKLFRPAMRALGYVEKTLIDVLGEVDEEALS
jgi:hypothetical protein